jgi:hypothetical protein
METYLCIRDYQVFSQDSPSVSSPIAPEQAGFCEGTCTLRTLRPSKKSRMAWHASGSNVKASISCLQSPRLPVGTLKEWIC